MHQGAHGLLLYGRQGHQHSQHGRPGTVAQRRLHDVDLAIGGHVQAVVARLDGELGARHDVEIARLRQMAAQRVPGQAQQAEPGWALRHVEAQRAAVQPFARADMEAPHLIIVVADEDEGRAPRVLNTVDGEAHAEKREAPQRRHECPAKRVHLPRPRRRCCWSRARTMCGYRPRLELLTKMRPLTSPTSTCAVVPRAMVAMAWSRSSGMFKSLAKWFSVPSGSTPSATPLPASTDATALMVPSPPPATTASTPRASARVAAAIISSPPCASVTSAATSSAANCRVSCALQSAS